MSYPSLRACVNDLERSGRLVRINQEVDPHLEAAEIHRRVHQAGGPAILFDKVKGCRFPMVSNLFGTLDRALYLFRHALDRVKALIELKAHPIRLLKSPLRFASTPWTALHMLPRTVRSGPVLKNTTSIDQLPQQVSWPEDGGAFVTLPAVYTEHPDRPGWACSNLGMYRVQLSGNRYRTNQEVGLHYQIHRGIGVHHAAAVRRGERLKVNVHVGGPPSLIFSAVMPLPENLSELTFAGALGNRRVRLLARTGGLPLLADADFAICGEVLAGELLPEGPFGDHLGYYSLRHDFPVLRVQKVFHRDDAIWPFTVVGRPPQEDTVFGELIHQLVGPVLSSVLPGVHAVHAVDAAGVHPLLLAIGSERYSPYVPVDRPQEVLTQASAILGHGQMSLAKYLWIASRGDDEQLDVHDVARFLTHVLCRVDWSRDLHFHTCTTIDTLDYSGTGLNQGSKVVIAGVGPPRRTLPERIADPWTWPEGFHDPRVVLPGVVVVNGPPCRTPDSRQPVMDRFCAAWNSGAPINAFPLVVVVDDSAFAAASLRNFLWVSFTRSDPAIDLYGIEAFIRDKHWGCRGALVLDARIKPHHAPPLVEDPAVTKRVDALGAPGGPLHGII